jgi:hypothetical protein
MEQTAVEWLIEQFKEYDFEDSPTMYIMQMPSWVLEKKELQAKEIQEKNLLEMLHKFGFDYTYNYRGEKTIYEWIPEWFENYKRLEQFKNK